MDTGQVFAGVGLLVAGAVIDQLLMGKRIRAKMDSLWHHHIHLVQCIVNSGWYASRDKPEDINAYIASMNRHARDKFGVDLKMRTDPNHKGE